MTLNVKKIVVDLNNIKDHHYITENKLKHMNSDELFKEYTKYLKKLHDSKILADISDTYNATNTETVEYAKLKTFDIKSVYEFAKNILLNYEKIELRLTVNKIHILNTLLIIIKYMFFLYIAYKIPKKIYKYFYPSSLKKSLKLNSRGLSLTKTANNILLNKMNTLSFINKIKKQHTKHTKKYNYKSSITFNKFFTP